MVVRKSYPLLLAWSFPLLLAWSFPLLLAWSFPLLLARRFSATFGLSFPLLLAWSFPLLLALSFPLLLARSFFVLEVGGSQPPPILCKCDVGNLLEVLDELVDERGVSERSIDL